MGDHHDLPVCSDEYLEDVGAAGEHLHARLLQFEPRRKGQQSADDTRQRERQLHGPDVLVVVRIDQPAPASGMIWHCASQRGWSYP